MASDSMLLNWSIDQCRRKLKQLEHVAYSAVVQAFRAQGSLTKEKKKILLELQTMLQISVSVHKCELRHAVNREELHTIAYRIAGPNTACEWAIEGKRLCPLLPRALEQTDNVILADALVKVYKAARAKQKNLAHLTVNDLPNLICSECSPRDHENLTTFEDIRKHIVQVVERQKAKLNAPKDSLTAEENSKKGGLKRKRTDSAHSKDVHHKVVIIDPSPEGGFRFHESANEEIITLPPVHESSGVPFQALTGDENNSHLVEGSVREHKAVLTPISSRPTISVPLTKCQTVPALNVTVSSTVLQKSIAVPIFKTATAPLALPNTSQGKSSVSIPFISASQSSVVISSIPSTISASVVNSISTPLCSVAASHPHVVNSLPGSVSDTTIKTQAKILAPAKKLVRPRLTKTNFSVGSPSLLNHLSTTPQLPSPNTVSPLHKAVISLKACSPSLVPTSSASNIVSSQVSSTASTFKRPISPLTVLPRVGSSVANSAKVKPPVTLKYCQTKMPVAPPKSAVLSKGIAKNALMSTIGGRSVVNSSSKSSSAKNNTLDTISSSTLKSSTSQVLPPNKVSGSIALQQKVLATQSLAKTTTAAKNVPFRSEGGLKIVSQNVPNNRILPKPGTSTTSVKAAVTTSSPGLTKNARIVNLATPIKLDRSAFSLHSTSSASTSAIRLNSSSGISTPGGRATAPAKPNVIVVHKAQVYPQTSGSAFVMPSNSSLSRISEEANDETVTPAAQHKETGKTSSQENSKPIPIQSLASSAVTKSCSLITLPVTTSHQIEQSKREKRLERHSNIKLPGTAEAITLIQRKLPGKLSSAPEKIKIRTNQQTVSTNISENKTTATVSKESASSKEISLESKKSTSCCTASKDVNEANKNESYSVEFGKPNVSDMVTTVSQSNACVMPIKCDDTKECISIPRKLFAMKNTSVHKEPSCPKDNSTSDSSTRGDQVSLHHTDEKNESDCFYDNEKKPVVFEEDVPDFENSMLLVNQDSMTSSIDIQSINLDQLQEGEVLALQPQDAAELLSQHGPLSKEVIELLQQAGLEVVNVPTEDDQAHDNGNVCYVGSCLQSTEITSDSFEEITCEDGNESSISLDVPYTCHSRLKIPKCT